MNMEERDKIKNLLKALSEKLKKPENKDLRDEFVADLSVSCTTGEQRLDDIYELCIEKIIKEQANAFYKDFPIEAIRSQLVTDFIRMERARRRDDFEEFCMAVYQQIECMVNKIGNDSDLNAVAEKLFPYPAYSLDGSVSKRKDDSSWLVSHMVFGKGDYTKYKQSVASQYAMDKFKCILYFVCYKASPQNDDYRSFHSIWSDVEDIYNYRNKNHRGNKPTDKQKEIYNRIDPIQSLYYLKTIGLLAKIVEMIHNGYPLSKELIDYAKSVEKKELKQEPNVISNGDVKDIEKKVKGSIINVKKGAFFVKIEGHRYEVKGDIKDGIDKGDEIEIDGYKIIIGDNISIKNYKKI